MSESQILMYQMDDRSTKIEVRLEDETVWLSQKQMAELFQTTTPNINIHIQNVFEEGELEQKATIKDYLIVQTEGDRKNISRNVTHYNLDLIISVGYRVKSHIGTKFRIWATKTIRDFLVKGFVMDDQKLMDGGKSDRYFEELLERIRAIRASERYFYQKITDIFSTSIDYDANHRIAREFFATTQNKFHYAIHHHTASEVIVERANAEKPNMGLTNWKNGPDGPIRKADVLVAKNYLNAEELSQLNAMVDQFLSFAELQAQMKKAMHMSDWIKKLHGFLQLNDRDILADAGKVTHDLAKRLAETQFDKFEKKRRKFEAQTAVSDFDKVVKQIENKAIVKKGAAKAKSSK